MVVKKIFSEDLQIAKSLIVRDEMVTRKYFYQQCYPLFKSIFDNYYTDCANVKEFIDEMYIVVLAPSKLTGKCQMENFRGESTLTSWLKTACLFYCYKQFEIKGKMPRKDRIPLSSANDDDDKGDRSESIYGSLEIDFSNINRQDAQVIIKQMPNKRYGELIRLRYLELMTNEEYNPQNEAFLHSRTSRAISQNETYRRNTPYPPLKNRPAYAGIHIL